MPEKSDLLKNASTLGDEIFLRSFPVHPMVALFIALPLESLPKDFQVSPIKHGANVIIQSGVFYSSKHKKHIPAGLPFGMAARRILLFFFHHFYLNPDFKFRTDRNTKEVFHDFGYNFVKNRRSSIPSINFQLIPLCDITFTEDKHLKEIGVELGDDPFSKIFLRGTADDGKTYVEYKRNPKFIFSMRFPVDFKKVLKSRKKSEFWNVYLFLVDVLPRIPKGKTQRISWAIIHDIFYQRYGTIANSKYYFKKHVSEVFEIYPQAKTRVDTSDSEDLLLKNAPAPI